MFEILGGTPRRIVALSALVLASSLAACGGGSGGSAVPQPLATPIAVVTAPPGVLPSKGVSSFTVTLPALKHLTNNTTGTHSVGRRVNYVSQSTTKIAITAFSVNGATLPDAYKLPVFVLDNTNCVTNADLSRTCQFSAEVPSGQISFSLLGYMTAGGVNTPLEQFYQVNANIAPGTTPTPVHVTMRGVIGKANLTAAASQTDVNNYPLVFAAQDFAGNVITGSWGSPITLAVDDSSGVTGLSVNGGSPSSTANLSNGSDTLTLHYDGSVAKRVVVSIGDYEFDPMRAWFSDTFNASYPADTTQTLTFICVSTGCQPSGVAAFTID